MNSYFVIVTSADGNEVAVSLCVGCDDNSVNLLVDNLSFSSFYKLTIKSNNSMGEQSTTVASFCKYTFNVWIILSYPVDKCFWDTILCGEFIIIEPINQLYSCY